MPPSYTPPQPAGGMVAPHRGTMILVFGILSFVCSCVVLGIIAWVMGSGDLKKIRAGLMDPAGEGMTKAGMILGIINCCLAIAGFVIWIILMALGVAVGGFNVRHP